MRYFKDKRERKRERKIERKIGREKYRKKETEENFSLTVRVRYFAKLINCVHKHVIVTMENIL